MVQIKLVSSKIVAATPWCYPMTSTSTSVPFAISTTASSSFYPTTAKNTSNSIHNSGVGGSTRHRACPICPDTSTCMKLNTWASAPLPHARAVVTTRSGLGLWVGRLVVAAKVPQCDGLRFFIATWDSIARRECPMIEPFVLVHHPSARAHPPSPPRDSEGRCLSQLLSAVKSPPETPQT
ncbi:hypothetical protein C8R44DRAFT_736509 [Mycena epipterygia]|nr:hypothetical protein C8R44DRAFT_736509 [Mycena epipterygia]